MKEKFIPCSEMSQIFSFQRTNRKSSYRDRNVENKNKKIFKKKNYAKKNN